VCSGRSTMKLHCMYTMWQWYCSNVITLLHYHYPTTMGGVTFSISEVVYWVMNNGFYEIRKVEIHFMPHCYYKIKTIKT
jgi:hypothetical protein